MQKQILLKYAELALTIILIFAWINDLMNHLFVAILFIVIIIVSFLNRKTASDSINTRHLKDIFLIEYRQKFPIKMLANLMVGIIFLAIFILIMFTVVSFSDFFENLFKLKVDYPHYAHPLFILAIIPASFYSFWKAFQKTKMFFQLKKGPALVIQNYPAYMKTPNAKLAFDLEDLVITTTDDKSLVLQSSTSNQKNTFPDLKLTHKQRNQFMNWIAINKL